MPVIAMHEHVDDRLTHYLDRKPLRLRLDRITVEAMSRGKLAVDDAHQLVHHQEDRRIRIYSVKLIGHRMPVIPEDADVIHSRPGARPLDCQLVAKEQDTGHVEFLRILLAGASEG